MRTTATLIATFMLGVASCAHAQGGPGERFLSRPEVGVATPALATPLAQRASGSTKTSGS
jgi:hypothetical protein